MSKAILVMDKQESCWGCPLEYDNMGICILAENGIIEHGVIQRGKNCPLIEAIGYIQPVGNLVSWEDDNDGGTD